MNLKSKLLGVIIKLNSQKIKQLNYKQLKDIN
jgi:hypothetical protein